MYKTPSKRRWFQLHLSTALLLMLVAGTLMSFNLQQRTSFFSLDTTLLGDDGQTRPVTFHVRAETHGWPFWTDATFKRVEADGSEFQGYTDFDTSTVLFRTIRAEIGNFDSPYPHRFDNGGVALAILAGVAVLCELLTRIRRRDRERAKAEALASP